MFADTSRIWCVPLAATELLLSGTTMFSSWLRGLRETKVFRQLGLAKGNASVLARKTFTIVVGEIG